MKTYKNQISTAMSEYREDFHYNKEWWTERMGVGNNNEYLWIQFKNCDSITVQADYFQHDGNTCLPRFRADEVAYISRYYGDRVETTTAADIVVDTDCIILYHDGVEYFRYEMTENEVREMRRQMWELDDGTDATAWMLDYCRALATSKMNNTPATMNANDTIELGYNAGTRSAMIDAARAFLVLADELNEQVSAYIDGSDKPEAEAAYNAVKDAESVFLRYYCAYWDEPRRRPCLGYELAESSLPEDDEYFNGAA